MNLTRNLATFVAFISAISITVGALSASANAQTNVALVDVGKVFKSHPAFSQQLQSLRVDADKFRSETEQMKQALIQEASVLKNHDPSSAEFKAEETRLAQKSATMEVTQRNRMRDLMKQEAELHYATYSEVKQVIADYASRNGIQLIVRYNSQALDPSVPASIMQKVNSNVIYHNGQKDITDQIIALVAQRNAAAGHPARR